MADLVTAAYVTSVTPAASGADSTMLASLISAVSQAVERYCRRSFTPARYQEYHDAGAMPFLMLRRTPVLALNAVTFFPTGPNPINYAADQFDLRPEIGRLSFRPELTANFPGGYAQRAGFAYAGLNAILVDYNAGFGFLTTASAAIAAGPASVTPQAMSGLFDGQPWTITPSMDLTIDPDQDSQEIISVISTTATGFAAVFVNAHAAGCQISSSLIPQDIQLAAALAIGNVLNQPDLSKQRESQGKTVGYEYVARAGDLIFTPEIKAILDRYRDVLV